MHVFSKAWKNYPSNQKLIIISVMLLTSLAEKCNSTCYSFLKYADLPLMEKVLYTQHPLPSNIYQISDLLLPKFLPLKDSLFTCEGVNRRTVMSTVK